MGKKIKVSGVGCCLVDRVYNNISFHSNELRDYLSRKPGDGGLVPGNLVFREEFENPVLVASITDLRPEVHQFMIGNQRSNLLGYIRI